MHKRGLCCDAVSVCPAVCLLSVTFVHSVEMNKHIFKIFIPLDSQTILVLPYTRRHGNIPTGTPLTGTSNAGWICSNRDSEPISGFTACCQRYDRLGVINTVPPDRGKLRHLSLVVSGGVCWRRETTTTKCLWQTQSIARPVCDSRATCCVMSGSVET